MKIVHVAESFATGILDVISNIANGMPESQHVIIHGRREETPQSFAQRFPKGTLFYPWPHAARELSAARDLQALFALVGLLKGMRDADAIHLHSSKAGFLGRLACRLLDMQDKTLYSPHGAAFLRQDVSPAKVRLYRFLEKTAARFGGRVIASSASEAAAFIAVGIPAAHIDNGISCAGSSPAAARHEGTVIATAARITPQKNPLLFNEIAQAFAADPAVRFVWLGDGELRHQLSSPNIQVSGLLPLDELRWRLADIDIYLLTSLYEGLSLCALLAMAAGKPLLALDAVGNRDLVVNDENGRLFTSPAEAIEHIRRWRVDKPLAESMGKRSQELVRTRFSLQNMADRYRELYRSLAAKQL